MRATIAAEEGRLLDITNETPDKSQEVIASARLRVERLTKVILEELHPRIEAFDRTAAVAQWNEQAEKLQAESDELWAELETAYAALCSQLIDVWQRIDRNAAAISEARCRRPSGADRHLVGADHPRLRDRLRLPFWDEPERIRFPKDQAWELQVAMTNAMVDQAKALEQKHALMYSDNWWAAKQLEAEQQRAENEKREAEMKAKAIADREAYHRSVQEQERRRMRGEI